MSESNEHYSPPDCVESARSLMGGVDLDPASCELANNEIVMADCFFDREADGFNREWWGRVWLNPPGGICDNHGRTVLNAKKGVRESCNNSLRGR
jgi:hypothetical protein